MLYLLQLPGFEILSDASPILIFVLIVAGTFVSEDATCVAAGVLAGQSRISLSLAIVACFSGIVIGDILLYWIGRSVGRQILQVRLFSSFISDGTLARASLWIDKRGAHAIFLSRFVTGLRLPTYFAAGFLRTNFWRFAFFFLVASAIWTPLVVASSAFATTLFPTYFVLGAVSTYAVFRLVMNLVSWKSRKLFVGRLKRIIRWEFWPLKVFYFPVVLYVAFLAIKYRSLTVFTCANPAIPASGFVGESKNAIYELLLESGGAAPHILEHLLLPADVPGNDLLERARDWMSRNGLTFPLILKPDAGERGKGVQIVRDFVGLRSRIITSDQDLILQEFAAGVEASVFYFRHPDRTSGEIFSLTEKRFPVLVGNGAATLEELILIDGRSVCLANKYFEHNSERLLVVPAQGEEIQIVDIGTHSRGAIFLEGSWLQSKELENKIDAICGSIDGFYFGRFDLRAETFEELRRGHFKIIELNGVTSESTNIYDPRYSLLDAYRTLFRQWRVAFEIGAANRARGFRPTSLAGLLSLILNRNGVRSASAARNGDLSDSQG